MIEYKNYTYSKFTIREQEEMSEEQEERDLKEEKWEEENMK